MARQLNGSAMAKQPTGTTMEIGNMASSSQPSTADPNLVDWNGSDDPDHPQNWAQSRKWTTLLPMSLFNFLSSISSSLMAPGLTTIHDDLGFQSQSLVILSLSIFLLGTAFVPLFTAPLSEVFGRSIVLQICNVFYLVFNTLCGAAKSPQQLIAFRFLAGLGGAGPFAIGSGINADLFRPRERGNAIAVYVLAPLIGVAVGPIAGAFLVQYVSWRWLFYIISIAGAAVQLLCWPLFHETYAPVLLERKCKKLRRSTANSEFYTRHAQIALPQLLRVSAVRPFKMLAAEPIVQAWSLFCAYLWGVLYLVIATFPNVWTDVYHESVSIGSLNYISLFIGMGLASQGGTRLADRYYRNAVKKNDGVATPEMRLPVLIIGSIIVPVGLFWYGWSARSDIHWVMPNIGAGIFAAGAVLEMLCVIGYLIDTYSTYTASAMAAVIVLRSIAGVLLPLAAPSLYRTLGFGMGNTVLAIIAVIVGIPATILLYRFGPALRKRSSFAKK